QGSHVTIHFYVAYRLIAICALRCTCEYYHRIKRGRGCNNAGIPDTHDADAYAMCNLACQGEGSGIKKDCISNKIYSGYCISRMAVGQPGPCSGSISIGVISSRMNIPYSRL